MVLVDAGDALSRVWPSALEEKDRPNAEKRAAFLLEQMGVLGYAALAVGERELLFAPADLAKRAAQAKVALLAANLTDAKGAKPFAGRTMVTAGGRRVGIFAVCEGGEYERAGLKVGPALEAAQAQADLLRKEGAQLVIGLLHVPYSSALHIGGSLTGVDYVVQSHDGRPVLVQQAGATVFAGGGARGQSVGRAVFSLDGKGPLFLVPDTSQVEESLREHQRQAVEMQAALEKSTVPEEKVRLTRVVQAARKRTEELKATLVARPPAGRRAVKTDELRLNARVADEPAMKKAQEAALAAAPERR
ncbi:MAG: hypothetical protein HY901_11925 [Deltaproteobacteria bacterium]|nr:hypothetical protein [Deltaproteobacteria bacterium]